jgi:hypothetical protein
MLRTEKVRLLRTGVDHEIVTDRIAELRGKYLRDVRALDLHAPSYAEAHDAALRLVRTAWS